MENGQQMAVRPQNGAAPARQQSKPQALRKFLDARLPQLAEWAQGKIAPEALVRFAVMDYSQSEQLQRCTLESIYLSLIACAQVGLEPGGIKQEAFIVPYKQTATFQPGYRGLIKLAMRSGAVKALRSHVVYEGDTFEPDLGSEPRVIHKPALRERGKMLGAYALAKVVIPGADEPELEVEWMPLEELERIRESSKRGDKESPAYRAWADQMYRKAPIRRLCKRLPLGEEYVRAARLDELAEGGNLRGYQQTIGAGNFGGVVDAEVEPEEASQTKSAQVLERRRQARAARPTTADKPAAKGEPPPADPATAKDDDLTAEIRDLEQRLGRVLQEPGELPALCERVERLPEGEDRDRLLKLCHQAGEQIDAEGEGEG